jgi:hypothetical protein
MVVRLHDSRGTGTPWSLPLSRLDSHRSINAARLVQSISEDGVRQIAVLPSSDRQEEIEERSRQGSTGPPGFE